MQNLFSDQASPELIINENFDSLGHVAMYARRPAVTTGLVWGFYGGDYGGTTISDGTVTLTASSWNHIVMNRTTGAVSASTSTTNWDNLAGFARIYRVFTSATGVSDIEDYRHLVGGVNSPLQGSPAPVANLAMSSTFVDLTGISSAANQIVITFYLVSTTGSSPVIVQLGRSTGVETTGYTAACSTINSSTASTVTATNGFPIAGVLASDTRSGAVTLRRHSGNFWVAEGTIALADGVGSSAGVKQLGGTLDRIRITTVGGTETFDGGTISVMIS